MTSIDPSPPWRDRPSRGWCSRRAARRRGRSAAAPSTVPLPVVPPAPPRSALRRLLAGVRAWMVVLPVDAALLAAPALVGAAAVRGRTCRWPLLGLALLTGGRALPGAAAPERARRAADAGRPAAHRGRDRRDGDRAAARAGRRRRRSWSTPPIAIGLVVAGRVADRAGSSPSGRRRRVTQHRTVLIGGGALAAELAQILRQHPRYGLSVVGLRRRRPRLRGRGGRAAAGRPRRPRRGPSARSGADVLLIADGDFAERDLLDVVRTPGRAALRPAGGAADAPLRHADRARRPHRLDPGLPDPHAEPARPGPDAQAGVRRRRRRPGARRWSRR